MDRRSWLWRRNSSEKSPGETESSGSISSLSERLSGEQAYAAHSSQSLEVTSKAVIADDEVSDREKALTERLSAALLNISAKEEIVKQHAKVAEEAVSGWEKAENEVSILKKQLESTTERNSSLENRVVHLDGALKECLRQLRQSRDEQEQRTSEYESVRSDLRLQLDAAERQNSALKSNLLSQAEEMEVITVELDLSTKAAEAASKQNLESIKKVAKLEAEIRRLKAVARRVVSASSYGAESYTDSQSDAGERILAVESNFRNEFESQTSDLARELHSLTNEKGLGKNRMVSSLQIELMDDFLEMERLAGLPNTEAGSSRVDAKAVSENSLRSELDAMINRTAELEEEIEKKEEEKAELKIALKHFGEQLGRSETILKEAEARLAELEARLMLVEKLKGAAEEKIEATESQLRDVEALTGRLRIKIKLLEEELGLERAEKVEKEEKCRTLEEEISRLTKEAELQQEAELHRVANSGDELKLKQTQELEYAANRFAECQKTIASLGQKLKSLASLEDFLADSDEIPGLVNEEDSEHHGNGDGSYKSDPSDSDSQKRESDYTKDNFSIITTEKASERGAINPFQNRNVSSEKSRHGLSKLLPESIGQEVEEQSSINTAREKQPKETSQISNLSL